MNKHLSRFVIGPILCALVAAAPSWATMLVYSNIDNGPTAAYSQPVGTQIGDELLLTQGGVLSSVGVSVYNSSSSLGFLDTADFTLDFWNASGSGFDLAGSLFYDDVAVGLEPGYFTTFLFGGISGVQTISLTDDILAVLTISDPTGGATRVGQVLCDPPTVGASDDNFYVNDLAIGGTKDGWYWFSGNPVANFYWSIEVEPGAGPPVPEPASLILLATGLAGLVVFRRRVRK